MFEFFGSLLSLGVFSGISGVGMRNEQSASNPCSLTETSPDSANGRAYGLGKLLRRRRSGRKGAAVVEFAVVLPVFLLMVLGMIEYGRLIMVQQIITNASREGARGAVIEGATNQSVNQLVTSYLEKASIRGATVTVSPSNPGNTKYGDPIAVTASIPFNQVSWLPSPMFLGGKTMTAVTVMRRESTSR